MQCCHHSFFYEILAGKWVRNGLQIKGQAMTYIQANFCNSMADMDLFFLQICATNLSQYFFLQNTIELFDVGQWLETAPLKQPQKPEQSSMLEGFLTFLATLVTSRTNLGNDEATQCIIEISALLATENKTHSQLLELMPERSGNVHTKNFETFLKKLSVYKAPSSGSENLEQGLFTPIDEVWEEYYDPLHVLLRAVHRRDFQSSLDRFTNYVKSKNKMPVSGNLWPPFRLPLPVGESFTDPCRILNSRLFHSTILSIFFRAVHTRDVSEHLLALAVFLLEIAVETSNDINAAAAGGSSTASASSSTSSAGNAANAAGALPVAMVECEPQHHQSGYYYGGQRREPPKLFQCYPTDNLGCNLRHVVSKVSLKSRDPQVTTSSYRSNPFYADLDFDVETEARRMIGAASYGLDELDETSGAVSVARSVALQQRNSALSRMRMEVALVPDLSVVAETGVVLLQPDGSEDGHDNAMDMSPGAQDFHHFPLQQITLPESGMEVAIRRDLLLAETTATTTTTPGTMPGSLAATPDDERTGQTGTGIGASDNEMFSPTTPTGSGMLLPFQRVRLPVAVPSSNMDVVPSNSLGGPGGGISGGVSGVASGGARKRAVDIAIASAGNRDELHMDESILSLLLKLHSQLSGNLDSFSLDDHRTTISTPMDVDCNEASTSSTSTSTSSSSSSSTALAERFPSYSYQNIHVSSSRIGDGPFFIGNLLRKIATRDAQCAQCIDDIRARLWPNQREKQAEARARETKEKEERRKMARERQQKMMQDFANKQKQFMQSAAAAANNMDFGLEDDDEEAMYEEQPREKEYDCIICNCTTASTETNPIGLVVLVESSGIVGHRRRIADRLPLPLNDADKERLKQTTRLANEFTRRTDLLSDKFGQESWYLSNNMAYDNGVHVQSCGHHVHLSCLEAYLKSLYTTQRQPVQDRGEFYCPVCRQLSNSVLPLSPQLDRPMHLVRSGNQPFEQLVADLTDLIKENETMPQPTKLTEAMGHAMEVMTNIAQRKVKCATITFRKLFIFVTSIARTNLEAEIIQRGGSLCTSNATRYKPKRDCIVPLLHVLSVHVRVLVEWPLWSSWASLAGMPVNDTEPLPAHCRELIPSLLADPIALLLKFILLAPLHLDQDYFTCMVKVMYNLLYYQIVVQLCVTLTELECDHILANYGSTEANSTSASNSATTCETAATETTAATANSNKSCSSSSSSSCGNRRSSSTRYGSLQSCAELGKAMALVLEQTDRLTHLRRDSIPSTSAAGATAAASGAGPTDECPTGAAAAASAAATEVNLKSMELQLQSLCLPFLRIAALLRQHLYRHEMPEISAPGLEFVRLVYYLELVTDSMDWDCFNASKGLCFIPGTEQTLPQFWCKQLMDVHPPRDTVRKLILMNQHSLWQQPRLLELPREYERLFTYYHERPCLNCYKVPKESSICLLCGTIVCLKQNCCAEKECCEAVRHTISCGGGIGIFLVVTSTYIIVIRGRRACLWGSLYLDDFDEEDRDLKRGKPLYLSQDRFNLLESQWLSHKFAHTKHTWVFHRDLL
ncbi:GH24439 [Drosophila grimshawi]|uniref:E3 ubiquitin-protein ligase n=1 Tax=Drosophila grimshawi TaxID=7222 RepID=B4JLX3_DROGR|nr:GH24439 [Drosophila grimshawi]